MLTRLQILGKYFNDRDRCSYLVAVANIRTNGGGGHPRIGGGEPWPEILAENRRAFILPASKILRGSLEVQKGRVTPQAHSTFWGLKHSRQGRTEDNAIFVTELLRGVYSDTTKLNSTAWTTVDSVYRSWRHKQKHDWLGCALFNWVSWVQLSSIELSYVAINTPLVLKWRTKTPTWALFGVPNMIYSHRS